MCIFWEGVYKILRNADDLRDAYNSTPLNFKRQKYDVNGKRGAEKGAQCVQMCDMSFYWKAKRLFCYISVSDDKNINLQHNLTETIQ